MKEARKRGRPSLSVSQRARLKELLKEAPSKGYTMAVIARMAGVHLSTVRNYKARFRSELGLAREGLVRRAKIKDVVAADLLATGGLGSDAILSSETAKDLLSAFPNVQPMSPSEVMKAMTVLVREGQDPVKVQAAKVLEDLRLRYDSPVSIGPPPPTSYTETVDALTVQLLAAGEDAAHEAVQRAFGVSTARESFSHRDME